LIDGERIRAETESKSMKSRLACLVAVAMLTTCSPAWAQIEKGSLDGHFNEGAEDCQTNPQAPLEVHPFDGKTLVLRENLCTTFEAPFMYLLIGSSRALLIDTGDVADPKLMPLAETVTRLLPPQMPLLVVHTHRHLDHRAGDAQFEHLPNVQVVGFDLDSVRRYYGFTDWPNGLAQLDLGGRTVDVIPTPGHNPTHISFYDRNTGLFFSGDFLMPGRLLIDDTAADLASANRIAAFVKDRPITYVLGGHIELNAAGETFPWESHNHPKEHVLQLSKVDLLALPQAVGRFNGFYTRSGNFILMNQIRVLIAVSAVAIVILIAIAIGLIRYVRGPRRARVGNVGAW
jgi:hydroxyacylglutathione hydrolase